MAEQMGGLASKISKNIRIKIKIVAMNFTIFAITIFETIDYCLVSSIVSHLILLNIFLSLFA